LTGCVLVRSNDRGVEHHPFEVRLLKGLEDGLPSPLLRPAVKALIDGVVLSKALWEVRPGRSGASDPVNRVDETAIVVGIAAWISGLAGEQRLDPLVLLVGKFVASSHRLKSSLEAGRTKLSRRRRFRGKDAPSLNLLFVSTT
jgi:hypothetical protein